MKHVATQLAHTLDRRVVLQAGGAAALGALLGCRAAETALAQPPLALRKALMMYMCKDGANLREKFAIVKRAGFEGVELDSPGAVPLDEIRAACAATGIVVCGVVDSVHWAKSLADSSADVRKEAVAALETALRDCAALGGTSVLLVPAIVDAKVSYDQAYTRSQAEIRRVLPLAAELKVEIAIENVWNDFLLSPLEAARYVDEFDSPWIGWHLDCGNVLTYGRPEQWIRILGPRLHKLHIKEYSCKRRDEEGRWKGFDVKLGEGDNDWKATLAALREIGFQGWASAEVAAGDEAWLRDVSGRMERIFAS